IFSRFFRGISSFHGGCVKFADKKRTKEIRFVFSQSSLREIGDEDALIVHNKARVDFAFYLPEDISERWGHEELPHLVLNRRNRFRQKSLVEVGEFIRPK